MQLQLQSQFGLWRKLRGKSTWWLSCHLNGINWLSFGIQCKRTKILIQTKKSISKLLMSSSGALWALKNLKDSWNGIKMFRVFDSKWFFYSTNFYFSCCSSDVNSCHAFLIRFVAVLFRARVECDCDDVVRCFILGFAYQQQKFPFRVLCKCLFCATRSDFTCLD